MRYIAAYLLLQLGGNSAPSAEDIKSLLSVVDVEADNDRLDNLISELGDKSVDELIEEGTSKLASVPSGGAAAAPAGAAAGGDAPAAEEKAAEKEEEKEESDEDMGFGLFD